MGLPCSSDSKESACNVGDLGSIPRSGRYPEDMNGYLLQYSCLENPTDRGAWQAIQLSDQHFINVSKLGSLCAVLC